MSDPHCPNPSYYLLKIWSLCTHNHLVSLSWATTVNSWNWNAKLEDKKGIVSKLASIISLKGNHIMTTWECGGTENHLCNHIKTMDVIACHSYWDNKSNLKGKTSTHVHPFWSNIWKD